MSQEALYVLAKAVALLEDAQYRLKIDCKMSDAQAIKFIADNRNTPEFESMYHKVVQDCKGMPESKDSILMKLNNLYLRSVNAGKDNSTTILKEIARWNDIETGDNSFNIIIEDKTSESNVNNCNENE